MGSKSYSSTTLALSYAIGLLFVGVGFVSSSIDQDRAECEDQVVGLATCLPYVGGQAKVPTPDCCSGIKHVLQKSKKCLCVLIKDRDDPSLGLKINLSLALGLPNSCHEPSDIKECIALLHLPPNSQEAKDFLGFGNNAKGANSTSAESSSSPKSGTDPQVKNDGGMKRKQWFGLEIFVWFFTSSLLLTCIW